MGGQSVKDDKKRESKSTERLCWNGRDRERKRDRKRKRQKVHSRFLFIDVHIVAVSVFVVMHNNHCRDLGWGNSPQQIAQGRACSSCSFILLNSMAFHKCCCCLWSLVCVDCYLMFMCVNVFVCEIPDRGRWALVACPAGQFVRVGTSEEQWGTKVNST